MLISVCEKCVLLKEKTVKGLRMIMRWDISSRRVSLIIRPFSTKNAGHLPSLSLK